MYEGKTLTYAFNQRNDGFPIHLRLIRATFLAIVILNIFLHAKLHQAAAESRMK